MDHGVDQCLSAGLIATASTPTGQLHSSFYMAMESERSRSLYRTSLMIRSTLLKADISGLKSIFEFSGDLVTAGNSTCGYSDG